MAYNRISWRVPVLAVLHLKVLLSITACIFIILVVTAILIIFIFTPSNRVSEVLAASIIRAIIPLMIDAASTSEKSVNFYQRTRRYNAEDSQPSSYSRP
jgi:uncharacterized membrane protein YqjE